MDPVTTLGFIGLGNFATPLAQACGRCANLRIGASHDWNPVAGQAFAGQFGGRSHAALDALLDDPGVDGVVIATPNDTHAEFAIAAARAGKHVFVEKPLCNDLEVADRLIAACQSAGVLLAVGHQERRHSAFRRIKSLITSGEMGKLYTFEANHCGNLLGIWPQADWRFTSTHGSGPLLHKGIHKIDILNHLFGTAETVATLATTLPFNVGMHQTTVSVLAYQDDVIGSLTSGFRHNNSSFNVYGEHLSVRYSGHGQTLQIKTERTWEVEQVACGSDDPLAEELGEFAAAIRGEGGIEVDGAVAREALVVAIAAKDAVEAGRPVRLDHYRQELAR